MIGIPIGAPSQVPEPKSGCRPPASPIDRITARELGATGSRSTLLFQALSGGKTGHRGAVGSGAADENVAANAAVAAEPIRIARSLISTCVGIVLETREARSRGRPAAGELRAAEQKGGRSERPPSCSSQPNWTTRCG